MRAVVRDGYGSPDDLELVDIDRPVANEDEVLVQVRAAGVNTADIDYLRGRPRGARFFTGLRRPKIRPLGLDVAGHVAEVGSAVTRFQPGDEVFGDLTEHGFGAFAEYACAKESAFAPKPANLTLEEAAAVPQAGVMALQGLRGRRRIEPGHRVLINGAGGGVGQFAVQIAKSLDAHVTGVDSAPKLDIVRSLGADHVIDYAREDYLASGERYDWILDVAAHRSLFATRRGLQPEGTYVVIPASIGRALQAVSVGPLLSAAGSPNLGMLAWKPFRQQDVAALTELIEAGKVTPMIDRQYALRDVAAALRHQEAGPTRGKIIITM